MFKDFFIEERKIRSSKNRKFFFFLMFKDFLLKNEGFEVLKAEKDFLVLENFVKTLWISGFLFIEDVSFNIPLEVICNIHRKSLRQKGIYLLTSAGCKFWL